MLMKQSQWSERITGLEESLRMIFEDEDLSMSDFDSLIEETIQLLSDQHFKVILQAQENLSKIMSEYNESVTQFLD